jgi:hypothetical protein
MKAYKIKIFNHIYRIYLREDNLEELYLFFNNLKGDSEKRKRIIKLFDEFLNLKKYRFKKNFIYCREHTFEENYKAFKKYILIPYTNKIKKYIQIKEG